MKKIRVAESNEWLLIKENADQIYFKYKKTSGRKDTT